MRFRLRIREVASPGPSPGTGAPTLEICPDLVLLARVVVVGSKPLVEGISMNPHCFGRFGLVPLILFQSGHDELAFELLRSCNARDLSFQRRVFPIALSRQTPTDECNLIEMNSEPKTQNPSLSFP